jgi:hypothetical protein
METYALELKRNHDMFLANLMLVLRSNLENAKLENYVEYLERCNLAENIVLLMKNFDMPKKGTLQDSEYKKVLVQNTSSKIQDNLDKLKLSSKNFLDSILRGDVSIDGVSGMIKKIFTAVSSNYELLKEKNPKLFQLKVNKEDGRQVTMTIIPGLDMMYSWYCLSGEERDNLWFYLENMFVSGTKMIHLVNETSTSSFDTKILKEINYTRIKKDFMTAFPEQQIVNVMNLDVDPFLLGVGSNNNEDFGVENILASTHDIQQGVDAPGIGSMAKMLGVDKMLNMEELSKQLKNISKTEIEEATSNIKKLLGSNVDENTSEMIGNILSDITEQLKSNDLGKGDPIQNIISIAEKVAQNALPKIDKNKVDMKKVFESTQNLANNYKDKDGKPILAGLGNGANPLAMLTSLMQNQTQGKAPSKEQMKMAQDMMKNLSKQMDNGKKQDPKKKLNKD